MHYLDPAHPWVSLRLAPLVSLQTDCPRARQGLTLASNASAQRFIGNNLTCKLSFGVFQIGASNSPVLDHSHVWVVFEALPSTSAPGSARERSLLLLLHCVPFRFFLFSKAIKSTLIAWPRMLFQLQLIREEVLTSVPP